MNNLLTLFSKVVLGEAQPFSPLDISGLQLWLDSNDASTITESLGSVSQWDDKSGNAYHSTQGTGSNQPITGTRTVNSLNVLDFDGSNHYLNAPSGLYSVPASNNTVFTVTATDSITKTNQRILTGPVGGGSRWVQGINGGGTGRVSAINDNGYTLVEKTLTINTSPHVIVNKLSSTTLSLYYDGGTATTGTGVGITVDALYLGATIGPSPRLDGVMGEILFYDSALADSQMNQVGNYLADKWGTTWTDI